MFNLKMGVLHATGHKGSGCSREGLSVQKVISKCVGAWHLSFLSFAVAAVALLGSGTASGGTITGSVTAIFGQLQISYPYGTSFLSYDSGDDECDQPGTGPGCFIYYGSGSFDTPTMVAAGFDPALNGITGLSPPFISGPDPVANEITFDGGASSGGISFDLVTVLPGGAPECNSMTTEELAAANTSCTIYISYPSGSTPMSPLPYVLTNSFDASTVSIFAEAYFEGYTGSSDSGESPYVGIFQTSISGESILNIFDTYESNGIGEGSWQGTFTPDEPASTTPEPGSLVLIGLGLIGIAHRWRKRR